MNLLSLPLARFLLGVTTVLKMACLHEPDCLVAFSGSSLGELPTFRKLKHILTIIITTINTVCIIKIVHAYCTSLLKPSSNYGETLKKLIYNANLQNLW